jgi:hypothetical protein
MSRILRAALVLLWLSIAVNAQETNMTRQIDSLEFRVDALERQVQTLQDSYAQNVRIAFQLEQLRSDFNTYISDQKKIQDTQNSRLWQFGFGPVILGIMNLLFLPWLVSRLVVKKQNTP